MTKTSFFTHICIGVFATLSFQSVAYAQSDVSSKANAAVNAIEKPIVTPEDAPKSLYMMCVRDSFGSKPGRPLACMEVHKKDEKTACSGFGAAEICENSYFSPVNGRAMQQIHL